ncbi:hypothetical protein ABPG75_011888 [Micractinium tetrahymenae]
MAEPAADWAALPADVLAAVFAHLLHTPDGADARWPLRPLLHQLLSLSHTCRHWAAVAAELPFEAELYAASPLCRTWLARRRLCRLCLASSPAGAVEVAAEVALLGHGPGAADAATRQEEGQQDSALLPRISEALAAAAAAGTAPQQPLRAFRAARSVGWSGEAEELFPWVAAAAGHSLTFDGMLQELEGVTDWSILQAPRPKGWALSAWPMLEELSLEGPVNWHGDFATLDAAALAGLARLRTLRLSHFYGYNLSGLPPSLRRLRLHFEPCLPQEQARLGLEASLSLLRLPEHLSLDDLVIVKRQGWVGFSWTAVSRRCRRLVLHNGLREREQRTVGFVAVPLSEGDDPEGRHVRLYRGTRVGPAEQAAAQAATVEAWLRAFKLGSDIHQCEPNRLAELCCALPADAWPGAPLLLVPVAEEGGEGGGIPAEEQLRRYHASLAQALLEEALFPALPAEVPQEWFSLAPLGLKGAALSARDSKGEEPVLAALRSPLYFSARAAAAPAEERLARLAL